MLNVERRGGVAVWTITRPETKNALDRATMAALTRTAEEARSDVSLRAVVLTGAGGAFVSGGDLRELREQTSVSDAQSFADAGQALCGALEALRVPVIAAIAGPAFGGGAELAMACDLRVCDPTARISFKQVRMGVTTAWGSIGRLVALVGSSGAARLLYTAEEVGAEAALELKLVDAVCAPGAAIDYAMDWAAAITLGAPGAVAEMKALLRSARADVSAKERETFVATWTGPEHLEAVEAYFARRRPSWSNT